MRGEHSCHQDLIRSRDYDELRTAGKPARLLLTTEAPNLTPDWNDIAYATATLVDANGTVVKAGPPAAGGNEAFA